MGIVWRRPVPTLRIKDPAYQEKMANIEAALARCDVANPMFYEDEVIPVYRHTGKAVSPLPTSQNHHAQSLMQRDGQPADSSETLHGYRVSFS